jgi:hypothetical protein
MPRPRLSMRALGRQNSIRVQGPECVRGKAPPETDGDSIRPPVIGAAEEWTLQPQGDVDGAGSWHVGKLEPG